MSDVSSMDYAPKYDRIIRPADVSKCPKNSLKEILVNGIEAPSKVSFIIILKFISEN